MNKASLSNLNDITTVCSNEQILFDSIKKQVRLFLLKTNALLPLFY